MRVGAAYLRGLGYRVRLARGLYRRRGYLAGGDDARADSLNDLIADPEVRCLLFARGGYGTPRILDRIDLAGLRRRPRLVVGFSDLTSLLMALQRGGRYPVGYGPHLLDLARRSGFDKASFQRILTEGPGGESFDLGGCRILSAGRAEGVLLGGCLTLLQSLVGTPWQAILRGAILFWEDWREEPYRIDRMLQHLRSAGALDGIVGMVVGRPVQIRTRRTRGSLSFEDVVKDHAGSMGIPVVTGLAAGHGPRKITLSLGVRARLDTRRRILETFPG